MVEAESAEEPRDAAQTAVIDILALEFLSTEVKASEDAEELNCADQLTIGDILEMSKEVKAEYARNLKILQRLQEKTLLKMQLLR